MQRRTQINLGIGAALLILAGVAAVVVGRSQGKPKVEASFIRYASNGPAVLKFTNRGGLPVRCSSPNAHLFLDVPPRAFQQSVLVLPRSDTQLLAAPYPPLAWRGDAVLLVCAPQPSKVRKRIEQLLGKVGIDVVSTNIVVRLNIPAK